MADQYAQKINIKKSHFKVFKIESSRRTKMSGSINLDWLFSLWTYVQLATERDDTVTLVHAGRQEYKGLDPNNSLTPKSSLTTRLLHK